MEANPEVELLKEYENNETLDFIYEYESLPKHIINELLVEFHRIGYLESYWRTGGVIKNAGAKALINAGNNKIIINVKGNENEKFDRRNLMIYAIAVIEKINKNLPYQPQKLIPLPNTNGGTVKYQILINRLKKRKKVYIFNEDLDDEQEFDIGELLDGIPSEIDIEKKMTEIKKIISDTNEKVSDTLENTEEIKSKLDKHFEYLVSLKENTRIKDKIKPAVQEIAYKQKEEISKEMLILIAKAFEIHQNDMDEKLKNLYNDLKKTDDVSAKLELSVPLLNLIGINFKTEFNLKSWSEKMYKKHKLKIFKLFEYV